MTALFASDAASTGWTAANQVGVKPGDMVAVWGYFYDQVKQQLRASGPCSGRAADHLVGAGVAHRLGC